MSGTMNRRMNRMRSLPARVVSTCGLAIVGAASWLVCTLYLAWVGAGE